MKYSEALNTFIWLFKKLEKLRNLVWFCHFFNIYLGVIGSYAKEKTMKKQIGLIGLLLFVILFNLYDHQEKTSIISWSQSGVQLLSSCLKQFGGSLYKANAGPGWVNQASLSVQQKLKERKDGKANIEHHQYIDLYSGATRYQFNPNPNSFYSLKIVRPSPLLIEGKIKKAVLRTSNGCGIGNYLIPSTGDTSNRPPLLGAIQYSSMYNVVDTVPGEKIKGVAFKRGGWVTNTSIVSASNAQHPYVVISDTGMFSYKLSERFDTYSDTVAKLNSVIVPGILKMAKQVTVDKTNPIVLLIDDPVSTYNISIYSYPGLQKQFSFAFPFNPEIFEVVDSSLYITGRDTSGAYMLYQFSSLQDTLLATYTLNDSVSNAQEFLTKGDTIFILSSPGDSMTVLSSVNMTDNTLSQGVIHQYAGARATHNHFKGNKRFTFQPSSAGQDSVLAKQILTVNPSTGQMDTISINRHLDYFKHPGEETTGFGPLTLGWIGARWKEGGSDTVYLGKDNVLNKIGTGPVPRYINATWGCWVGISDNSRDKIRFEVSPNPASYKVTIQLKGLTKGKQYKLRITDISGREYYKTHLKAYEHIQLPLEELPKGVYFLNLNTGNDIITKKLVIE